MSKFTFLSIFLLCLYGCTEKNSSSLSSHEDPVLKSETQIDYKILALGDSLTEGYGLDQEDSYPTLLEKMLSKHFDKKIQVVNAGVSGSTIKGGASRLDWWLEEHYDAAIVALGANDGLRGLYLESSEKELEEIVKRLKEKKIDVYLSDMKIPPNYGPVYRKRFEKMFQNVAKKQNIPLLPFLLDGVAGKKDLNLQDGIHPNQKGQKIVAENLKKALVPYLEKKIHD